MALNFLEMNRKPEKFNYFERFIDQSKFENMRRQYQSGQREEEREI
jgi:hypothetical protein